MSRYIDPSSLALAVLAIIQPHSSMRPISQADLLAHTRTMAPPADIHDAVEQLLDALLISHMSHTRGGVTQNFYWPTGLKPINAPSIEAIRMASEPKNSLLNRLIVLHGPIVGTALAWKARDQGANIPAKNVPGLLETLIRKQTVIVRKKDGANWYMTPSQADEWDTSAASSAGLQDAGEDADDIGDEAGAHVMSAPPASTEQCGAEIRVNETATENAELEELKARVHDLLNDVAAANLIFAQMQDTLRVDRPEDIPGALDEMMHTLTTRVMQPAQPLGRLALIVYSDTEADLQFLEPYVTENDASQIALNQVNAGSSERCAVIRVLGEARRPEATWEALVAPAISTLRGENQEAA